MHATVVRSMALTILVAGWSIAANDPFVGKWKLNAGKSEMAGQRFKVEELGPNKYEFDDGSVPQVIVANGTDQPMELGGTMSLQMVSEEAYKAVYKRDGRVLSEQTWTRSPDGKTVMVHSTGTRLDGSTFDDEEVLSRVAGTSGNGMVGTWESKSEKLSSPAAWEIQPYEGAGLSFVSPSSKSRLNMRFDGKEYVEEGPNAPKGVSTSGKRANANTLQLTDKHDGKVLDTEEWKASPDGKTLTMTHHTTGQQKPMVFVYERQ
jgi:hypothetical protein